jgi:tetratricopeptide (TPR) repeat protein
LSPDHERANMSFNDLFFMIVIPVAAALATAIILNLIWKSRFSALARSFEQRLKQSEERFKKLASTSEQGDDISRVREQILYQWQSDLLELSQALEEELGTPEILQVDVEFVRLKEGDENLNRLIKRIDDLKEARVPIQARLSFTIGYFLHRINRMDVAQNYYIDAIKADQTFVEPRFNLARLFLKNSAYDKAVLMFKQLRDLRSNNAEVYYGLGLSLIKLQKYEEGIEALAAAIKLNPENPAAYTELAEAYASNGDLRRAMESIQVALKLKPRFYEARLMQQELLIRAGDFDDVIRECEKYLNQKQDGRVYFNLARAHVLSGDKETGLKALRNAFQLDDSLRFAAKDERAFEDLRENRRFNELVEGHLGLF